MAASPRQQIGRDRLAGEGRRLYGRTTTSAMPNRTVMAIRRPVGVAGLIVSFNTPLPNYAWKAFPAVFCGNATVLKPSEHTPASAAFFGELCNQPPLGVAEMMLPHRSTTSTWHVSPRVPPDAATVGSPVVPSCTSSASYCGTSASSRGFSRGSPSGCARPSS